MTQRGESLVSWTYRNKGAIYFRIARDNEELGGRIIKDSSSSDLF